MNRGDKNREAPIAREKPLARELPPKRWCQDFLPGFLEADAKARESMISDTETQLHLARQFIRFEKALKSCRSPQMQKMLERYKQETLKLMQRT